MIYSALLSLSLSLSFVYGNIYCNDNSNPLCSGQTIGDSSNQLDIYCETSQSCVGSTLSAPNIICKNEKSCFQSSITSTGTRIECSDEKSCAEAVSISTDGDLQCTGPRSCEEVTNIDVAGNMYCNNNFACSRSNIQIDSDLYCDGIYACNSVTVDSGKSVNCNGPSFEASCAGAVIEADDNINCNKEESCRNAKLTAEDVVSCNANYACQNARIEAGSAVVINGLRGVEYGTINAPVITVNGEGGIYNAGIDSKSSDGSILSSMAISLNVNSAGVSLRDIICRSGSTCTINCAAGTTACNYVSMKCETGAACNVNPSGCVSNNSGTLGDGTDCPDIQLNQVIP